MDQKGTANCPGVTQHVGQPGFEPRHLVPELPFLTILLVLLTAPSEQRLHLIQLDEADTGP